MDILENELTDLLKGITPTPEARELFITFMKNTYYKRLGRLQKIRNDADSEITKLYETRKQLVKKIRQEFIQMRYLKNKTHLLRSKFSKLRLLNKMRHLKSMISIKLQTL